MPDSLRPSDPPALLGRRRLLRTSVLALAAGALGSGTLGGCGRIALGGPEEYTPPPPGIDDLYRRDLLALLERSIAGAEALTSTSSGGDPALAADLTVLVAALPVQRRALLTGAEQEREVEASEDPDPEATAAPEATDVPDDLPALLAVLVELRDLAADASRQVSGSLARATSALAAHSAWIALRLRTSSGTGEVPASPSTEDLVPRRDVPATDPPSIGAEEDYRSAIERAQQEEWYAGYVHEVLAARAEGEEQEAHLARTELHRTRAEQLAAVAEEDGAPVVVRQAVYGLPGGQLDEATAGALPTTLSQGLLLDHLALAGAAPFERRPLSIAAALAEAVLLAGRVDRMDPLPGLVAEDPPPADG
ncbi:DUF4439 domain-containing protein [Brachybacterium paraconglomeratum]|uniref:DUF4439 domain-containing protein n=1 Tax=Brachybacterium paraconglomeratum TaxID=173362 RepID=UPI0021A8DFBC|nr:DUF4439 domain-containing protein [Brachybacterium paraconglomeratum]MCT1909395.1 DUF4439 domain-containing protein [Brachybacterium paraconglomeratum]